MLLAHFKNHNWNKCIIKRKFGVNIPCIPTQYTKYTRPLRLVYRTVRYLGLNSRVSVIDEHQI